MLIAGPSAYVLDSLTNDDILEGANAAARLLPVLPSLSGHQAAVREVDSSSVHSYATFDYPASDYLAFGKKQDRTRQKGTPGSGHPTVQPLMVRRVNKAASEGEQAGQHQAQLSFLYAHSFSACMILANAMDVSDSTCDKW